MRSVRDLFPVAILLMVLHLVEQLLFGIDELYELRGLTFALVDAFGDPDRGIVVLVFAVTIMVLFFCYGFMAGGLPRLIAGGFFGLEFMGESHHLIKTIVRGAYFPGAVTAVAIAVVGALVLRAAWREYRGGAVAAARPSTAAA
jgi:hypothetical protein